MVDPKKNPAEFLKFYLKAKGSESYSLNIGASKAIETRTRQGDVTDALRFRVYDPLWMLSRQWQMGEFKGNNAGTAMSVSCKVKSTDISGYTFGSSTKTVKPDDSIPIEPIVEQIDRDITPLVRIESAAYFLSLVRRYSALQDGSPVLKKRMKEIVEHPLFKLDDDSLSMGGRGSIENNDVIGLTDSLNTRLNKFRTAYSRKGCDGYKLYRFCTEKRVAQRSDPQIPEKIRTEYAEWFRKRYLPNKSASSAWNVRELGYDFTSENVAAKYVAEDYSGGRVSWYSFDVKSKKSAPKGSMTEEKIETLPTLASYPGSPNKRLWEFEDKKVFMGNSVGMQAKGNVAFLQYATMYSNDWMICPLKTEIGKYIEVESITIRDSFGLTKVINSPAGSRDKNSGTFGQKWQMFTNAPVDIEHANSSAGLLLPPSLIQTLEGEPIEEVDLLRDEMANMVWAVESKIDDGCGSTIDASHLASEVGQFVEDKYAEEVEKAKLKVNNNINGQTEVESTRLSDYKYVLMTSVPFNWIPFVPQHLDSDRERKQYSVFQDGGREIILRRGKMPCFYLSDYVPVRPLSSILKVKTKKEGGKIKEEPFFINEEQVQGVGTQIIKNCQRSRWLGGKTFTWMGYSKRIKRTEGVSGLEFDNLVEPTK